MKRRVRNVTRARKPLVPPPSGHHLDYFFLKWRGLDKNGQRLPLGHPWHNLRDRVLTEFPRVGIRQVQQMGVQDPTQGFQYRTPLRSQLVGFDGTVMPLSRRHKGDAAQKWTTGDGWVVHGSKYTIASIRFDGEAHSRVCLSFAQTGKSSESVYRDEAKAVIGMAVLLSELSGGMKGIVVDSAVRGHDVCALQRLGRVS